MYSKRNPIYKPEHKSRKEKKKSIKKIMVLMESKTNINKNLEI